MLEKVLIPAHAGVIPSVTASEFFAAAYPRACGGDPDMAKLDANAEDLSPRMRG